MKGIDKEASETIIAGDIRNLSTKCAKYLTIFMPFASDNLSKEVSQHATRYQFRAAD